MPLNPQVKRFLDMAAAAGAPHFGNLTPNEMRRTFDTLARSMDGGAAPKVDIENTTLPGPGGSLPIRIYSPGGPDRGTAPGLIYFHGGGGIFGNLDTHDGLCRRLADGSGCRLISVDYRLAPEHKFPAAVEDAYAATAWIVEHAPELGLDPRRIAIGGDSAGGNLTAVVCQLARRRRGPDLALQVLLCPILDIDAGTESRRTLTEGYFLTQPMIDWITKHYLPETFDRGDPRISPLRAADFGGLPPAHIHTAEFDPLRDEGQQYADRLRQAGVAVNYICHEGMIHHFYGMAGIVPYVRTAIASAAGAIRQALA
jgi:acetyl esterase